MESSGRVGESGLTYSAVRPGEIDAGVAPSHPHTSVSVEQRKRPQDGGKPVAADRFVVGQGKIRLSRGLRVGVYEIEETRGCIYRRVEIVARRLCPRRRREQR